MDNNDILGQMSKKMGSMINLSNQLVGNLPDEVKKMIPGAQADIRNVQKALKSGDYSEVIKIQDKYANRNK